MPLTTTLSAGCPPAPAQGHILRAAGELDAAIQEAQRAMLDTEFLVRPRIIYASLGESLPARASSMPLQSSRTHPSPTWHLDLTNLAPCQLDNLLEGLVGALFNVLTISTKY